MIIFGVKNMKNMLQMYPYAHEYSDDVNQNLNIEIDLRGVEKENVVFEMHENSFFVRAKKKDVEYVGTYPTLCPVDADKAVMKYHKGMLHVKVPMWT